jgi:Cu/Zn superoxide dismutase
MLSIRATATTAVVLATLAGCGLDAGGEDLGGSWTAALTVTDGWSEVFPDGTGLATITTDDGTSVQLSVAGLDLDTEYTAHVHDGACDEDPPGGGHWLADPDGEDAAGNIIELRLSTSGAGTGESRATSELVPDERAKSVVVHAPADSEGAAGPDGDRVLCGDLEVV